MLMDSFTKSITHNARLVVEERFQRAFNEIPEAELDALTKHYGNLRLCFQLVEETGSYRHLHLLIPQLLKESEQHYGITFDFQNEFLEAMKPK